MKMLKSKKALSPVVATIILIAVTVAVSLAVAIWMGALTTGFMSGGERVKVGTPFGWSARGVKVLVTNEGGAPVKITGARVQGYGVDEYIEITEPIEIQPKETKQVNVTISTGTFKSGYEYNVILVTGNNNEFRTVGTCAFTSP